MLDSNFKASLSWIKNSFTLKVKFYEQNGDEVKLVNTQYSTERKKKIIDDIIDLENRKGIQMGIVRVGQEPNKVEFNKIYFRADGKMAWLYILKNPLNGAAVAETGSDTNDTVSNG